MAAVPAGSGDVNVNRDLEEWTAVKVRASLSLARAIKEHIYVPFRRAAPEMYCPYGCSLLMCGPSFVVGVCPLLCNGHGDYVNGQCDCHPSWKGRECNLRHEECEVSDCNGHGHCQEGTCKCINGFTGEFCEKGES